MALLLTERDTRQLITQCEAITAVEEALKLAGMGQVENPGRTRLPMPFEPPFYEAFLQMGGAVIPPHDVAGLKIFANFGERVPGRQYGRGWNLLFRISTGELLSVIQSFALGSLRTAAMTAVAAKYLSPDDAASVGLYGVGKHAEDQLKAIREVRNIQKVNVYNRTTEKAQEFCHRIESIMGLEAHVKRTPESVPQDSEVIVTVTSSFTPILFGEWITSPCLVAAVGANHAHRREVDSVLYRKAAMVVVDGLETAKVEDGALQYAIAHSDCKWSQVKELGHVVAGKIKVPNLSTGTILFSSHGLSLADVAVSARAYELAVAKGIGSQIDLDSGRVVEGMQTLSA